MGQKSSSTTQNWTKDCRTCSKNGNSVQIDDVIDGAKMIPMKYFGGNMIQNDPSMQQMQRDLLAFDNKLKRVLFFRRKKNKKLNSFDEQSQQQQQQQQYYNVRNKHFCYNLNRDTIPEEDEDQLSSYSNDNQKKSSS